VSVVLAAVDSGDSVEVVDVTSSSVDIKKSSVEVYTSSVVLEVVEVLDVVLGSALSSAP
jgi:hypothetical protein